MKVLITGASGLVGRAVKNHCAAEGDEVNAFDHKSLDIADDESIRSVIARARPDVVINCAAWTDVDGCESDHERAQLVNAHGPETLASVCREVDALFITISTDYVFDGGKDGFYTQQDKPSPISVYGQSKLDGEILAQQASERTIVVRSGYIFGAGGKNFLSTFLERAKAGNALKAISDMVGTPTYALDLARRLRSLALMDLPGTYHVVNAGPGVSFEGFARAAIEMASLDASLVQSVTLAALRRPARRPRNSRLRCLLSEELGLDPLPDWQSALRDFIEAASTNSPKALISGPDPD